MGLTIIAQVMIGFLALPALHHTTPGNRGMAGPCRESGRTGHSMTLLARIVHSRIIMAMGSSTVRAGIGMVGDFCVIRCSSNGSSFFQQVACIVVLMLVRLRGGCLVHGLIGTGQRRRLSWQWLLFCGCLLEVLIE